MALAGHAAATNSGLPARTFAKLSPHEYLLSHITSSDNDTSLRANGRSESEARVPNITKGSLTHAHGSAVVRLGDTTVICGVRGETLLTADIPNFRPRRRLDDDDRQSSELKDYDLLVPNIELATGSAPQFLPGVPPTDLAQVMSTRVYSLLHAADLVVVEDLRIWREVPSENTVDDTEKGDRMDTDEGEEEAGLQKEVIAYWVLYIDIFFISFDGNTLDAAWAALLAALKDTKLPHAYWDGDRDMIICTRQEPSRHLSISGLPIACTVGIFPAREIVDAPRRQEDKRFWVLVDPDAAEEEVCPESVTVVLDKSNDANGGGFEMLAVMKSGGIRADEGVVRKVMERAQERWVEWARAMTS